jgi:hypothetical protein
MIISEEVLPGEGTAPYLRLCQSDGGWEQKNIRYIFANGTMFWSGRDVLGLNPNLPQSDTKSVKDRFQSLIPADCDVFDTGHMYRPTRQDVQTWGHTLPHVHNFVSTELFVAYLGKLRALTSIGKVVACAALYVQCKDTYTFSEWWSLRSRIELTTAALASATKEALGITEYLSSSGSPECPGEVAVSRTSNVRLWRNDQGRNAHNKHAREDVGIKRVQAGYNPSSQTTDCGTSDEGVMRAFLGIRLVLGFFYIIFMSRQIWNSLQRRRLVSCLAMY